MSYRQAKISHPPVHDWRKKTLVLIGLKRDKKAVYRICSYCVCVHKILLVKVGFLIKPYIRNLFPNFLLNSILFPFENEIWNVFCPVHIFGFVKSVTYIHPNSVSKSGVEVFLHECEIYLLCDMTYFCDIERAYYFWNMCTFTNINTSYLLHQMSAIKKGFNVNYQKNRW